LDRSDLDSAALTRITIGKLGAPYGVRGWLKTHSYTDPPTGILDYPQWTLQGAGGQREISLIQGKPHGKALVVKLHGVDDRDAAARLTGYEVTVDRAELPALDSEYYWADLIGLRVINTVGVEMGVVERLIETGANDVLVVEGERQRLIPWVLGDVVVEVDTDQGLLRVEWDAEF